MLDLKVLELTPEELTAILPCCTEVHPAAANTPMTWLEFGEDVARAQLAKTLLARKDAGDEVNGIVAWLRSKEKWLSAAGWLGLHTGLNISVCSWSKPPVPLA